MAVNQGTTATASGANSSGTTWAHTIANNPNRYILARVTVRASANVTVLSRAGQSFTKIAEKNLAAGNNPRVEYWELRDPTVGAGTVSITFSGNDWYQVATTEYYNVDQITPIRDIQSSSGVAGAASRSVAGAEYDELVTDVIGDQGALTVNAAQTQDWNVTSDGNWRGAGSNRRGLGTVDMQWTAAGGWAMIAAIIRASLIQPVYDRTAADIAEKRAKAYLNVADWERIYTNTRILNDMVSTYLGSTVDFDDIALPTITTIPSVTDINKLVHNIERLRLAMGITSQPALRYTWGEGNVPAPRYQDVNKWEQMIATILDHFTPRVARTGVAKAGASLNRNNGFRHYAH